MKGLRADSEERTDDDETPVEPAVRRFLVSHLDVQQQMTADRINHVVNHLRRNGSLDEEHVDELRQAGRELELLADLLEHTQDGENLKNQPDDGGATTR